MTTTFETLDTLTPEMVGQRVDQLLPAIRERAAQGENDRSIPAVSAQEFLDAGLARILTPRQYGGAELGIKTWVDASIAIATADAAHGWVASLIIHHPHYLAQFPEAAQAAVWADGPDVAIAGTLTPTSRIEPAQGGYRISGRISYLSGVDHCS